MRGEKNAYAHKRLKVWQKSINLVAHVYEITRTFPESEKFGLCSQMRRSSISIPSNIAEGAGRNSDKEMIRFLDIARGSLFELDTQIEIAHRLKYISHIHIEKFADIIDEISRMLSGLRNLRSRRLPPKFKQSMNEN